MGARVKLNKTLIAILSLCSLSCAGHSSEGHRSQGIASYLTNAIQNTPYSALVEKASVRFVGEVSEDYWEYVIVANMLEIYRGEKSTDVISYSMIVPKEESINMASKPVIITLCKSDGELYWPGVGAEFPASDQLIDTAKKIKSKPNQRAFSDC